MKSIISIIFFMCMFFWLHNSHADMVDNRFEGVPNTPNQLEGVSKEATLAVGKALMLVSVVEVPVIIMCFQSVEPDSMAGIGNPDPLRSVGALLIVEASTKFVVGLVMIAHGVEHKEKKVSVGPTHFGLRF